jgi:hypothetical protein
MSDSVESGAGNTPVPGGSDSEIRSVNATGLGDSALRFVVLSLISGLVLLLLSFLWSFLGPLRFTPLSDFVSLSPDDAAQMPSANLLRTDLEVGFLPTFLNQLLFEMLPTLGNQLLTAIVVLAFVLFLVIMTLIALLGTLLLNVPIILLGGLCLVSGLVFTLSLFGSVLFSLGHVLFALLGR